MAPALSVLMLAGQGSHARRGWAALPPAEKAPTLQAAQLEPPDPAAQAQAVLLGARTVRAGQGGRQRPNTSSCLPVHGCWVALVGPVV